MDGFRSATFDPPRDDQEIVAQTNELSHLILKRLGTGFCAPADHKFYEAEDVRSRTAWGIACEVMEFLTGTDPEDALNNVEGSN